MSCGVCKCQQSKYKCPDCRILYCSLECWKEHRAVKCESLSIPERTDEEVSKKDSQEYEYPTEDTIPMDKLKLLANSEVLQKILQNPHLQELLVSVDNSPNPEYAMQLAMQEPLFVEFADECLRVTEPMQTAPT